MGAVVQNPNDIQSICSGMTYQWLDEGSTIRYTIKSNTRDHVTELAEVISSNLRNWNVKKPYHCIYEFPEPNITLSSYFRQQLSEISGLAPDLNGKLAIVAAHTDMNHAMRLFCMMKGSEGRAKEVFSSLDDALAWIHGEIDSPPEIEQLL